MNFIDTHAHVNFPHFLDKEYTGSIGTNPGVKKIIDTAADAGVSKIITIACDTVSAKEALDIAEHNEGVYASVGIHPVDCGKCKLEDIATLREMAQSHKKVVAIGEAGLDYFHKDTDEETQKMFFREQIALSKELQLPLVIHTRESDQDVYEILKKDNVSNAVIHCFASNWDFAQACLDLGLYISFTGILTYPKATDIQDAAAKIPLDRIMIETDCPFLAPQAYRGKQNQPAYVVEVAKKLAEIRGLDVEEIARVTTENAERFFSL